MKKETTHFYTNISSVPTRVADMNNCISDALAFIVGELNVVVTRESLDRHFASRSAEFEYRFITLVVSGNFHLLYQNNELTLRVDLTLLIFLYYECCVHKLDYDGGFSR